MYLRKRKKILISKCNEYYKFKYLTLKSKVIAMISSSDHRLTLQPSNSDSTGWAVTLQYKYKFSITPIHI